MKKLYLVLIFIGVSVGTYFMVDLLSKPKVEIITTTVQVTTAVSTEPYKDIKNSSFILDQQIQKYGDPIVTKFIISEITITNTTNEPIKPFFTLEVYYQGTTSTITDNSYMYHKEVVNNCANLDFVSGTVKCNLVFQIIPDFKNVKDWTIKVYYNYDDYKNNYYEAKLFHKIELEVLENRVNIKSEK